MTLKRPQIFYGWIMVTVAGVGGVFTLGTGLWSIGIFVTPMQDELGWSRGTISLAIAIGLAVNGLTQPFMGRLYDRHGGRKVISVSLLVLGACTMLLSQVNSFWFLVVIYGFVMSVAAGGTSFVTIHAVLVKWFYRKRGVVVSISTAGATAGSMVLVPFATYLIIWAGWRFTWVALGAFIVFLAFPLALLIIRDDPKDIGEIPDGDLRDTIDNSPTVKTHVQRGPLEFDSWQESYRTAPIWQLTGAYFVCGMTTAIISAHYIPFAIERGISPGMAAMAFGLMSGLNIVGVLVAGSISDKIGRKNVLATVFAIRGLAYVALLLAPGAFGIWGFAVVAGFSWVASGALTSSLTADIYGLKNMGTLGGTTTLAHQLGGALSVYLGGVLYDVFGSYTVPFGIAGALLIFATIAVFSIREKKYSNRFQPLQSVQATAPSGDGD
ncbi:MAG: MFS transporter [Chloroflexi bacterium]|nr:MFS transporter [Chloroflexota bacterium]